MRTGISAAFPAIVIGVVLIVATTATAAEAATNESELIPPALRADPLRKRRGHQIPPSAGRGIKGDVSSSRRQRLRLMPAYKRGIDMNVHVLQSFSSLATEFRGVMRGLARKPGYAIAAWVMLGLAIAANAAVFAIVWGFLLKPLPYAQPGQLSVVRERVPKIGLNTPLVSVKTYLALKQNLGGIADAGLEARMEQGIVKIRGQSHFLSFQRVTPSFLRTLGVAPVLGRLPSAGAGKPGGPAEAVISWRLWQSAYGGSHKVLDKPYQLGGKTYRIVGVMPRGFYFRIADQDGWVPYVITPERAKNGNINYFMIVRRKPGVSLHRLNLELHNYLQRLLAKEKPADRASDIRDGYTIDARSMRSIMADFGTRQLPWLLQAAAGFLLLLALANTINLGLVRQRARQHEFALRRVLGASRGGLVRLILIEHVPIGLAVGGVATLLAWAGIHALHVFGLPPAFSPFKVELSAPVIVFTWVLTALAILIVMFGPALLASGRKLLANVGSGPTATGGRYSRRLQRTLGTIQVALACALIVAGGLLGVSLWRVLSQPAGFEPQGRTVIHIELPDSASSNAAAWATLKPELLALPGVRNAAVIGMVPYSGNHLFGGISKIGAKSNLIVNIPTVSADYFSTMGIPLVAGRGYTRDEIANKAPVAIINESLARRFFGGANAAIGKSLDGFGDAYKHPRIVGVARDVRWATTPDQYRPDTAYFPLWVVQENFRVIVQTNGSGAAPRNVLKDTVRRALPGSYVFSITPLSRVVQGASVFRAAGAGMVGAFAALALLLAALGVFSITSFIARARLGEYGIRAALGASPLALLRLGFKEAVWLLAIGLPGGLAGAYLLGRVIAGALYQTPVLDWWLYVVGAVVIAAVVFAAAWRPARKAARVPIRDLLGGGGAQ
jgi:predicted permease